MRVGFHTNSLVWAGENDIEKIAQYAIEQGFTCLEMGPGIELDIKKLKETSKKIDFSALIYCRNFIDDDESVAKAFREELFQRMRVASELGAKKIITSTGISKRLSMDDGGCDPKKSLDLAVDFLEGTLKLAEELDLTICLENCPMYRNIATSPYMWREIFKRIPSNRLGICYDASHFVWQFIDVYKPLVEFKDKIHHLHIKDTKVDFEKLKDVGILHNTAKEKGFDENQWWRHTLLEEGDIDSNKFFDLVKKLDSPLLDYSFEMEDYKYELVPERVKLGLNLQLERLKKYLNI